MKQKSADTDNLLSLLTAKACVKQDVFGLSKTVFDEFKTVLEQLASELGDEIGRTDKRVTIKVDSPGALEVRFVLAGDTLVFHLHTNVFTFPPHHMVHKSPYVIAEPKNAYCFIINIYNFLTDSFKLHRDNDLGYLIGRIFVNRERHFFVDGKGPMGYKFNDFSISQFDVSSMRSVVQTAMMYALNFELYSPPFTSVQEVRIGDIKEMSQNLKLQTSKRLGFRFDQDENNSIEF